LCRLPRPRNPLAGEGKSRVVGDAPSRPHRLQARRSVIDRRAGTLRTARSDSAAERAQGLRRVRLDGRSAPLAPPRHRLHTDAAMEESRRVTVAIIPVPGLPMLQPGDDLATLLGDAIEAARMGLKTGDAVAVCQKVVSKAEGAVVDLDDVVASDF